MPEPSSREAFRDQVRSAARKRILFLPHAILQMSRPERMITPQEVRRVILHGSIIEDYPNDARGHSCLLLGFGASERKLHVVCSPKPDYLAVITAYLPGLHEWDAEGKVRRRS